MYNNKPALVLIDFQKGLNDEIYWGGNRNNKTAEEKACKLLSFWRTQNLPIIHVIHSSLNPESPLHKTNPGFDIKDPLKPVSNESIFVKNVNSAFIGTQLKKEIDQQKINQLVICGLTTDHCVSTTARMSGNFGYDTFVISDATATFDRISISGDILTSEIIHQTSLASLHKEFAEVIDSKSLMERMISNKF